MQGYRRTKIVATLGPSTATPKMVERLINKGVNVFRLNFSHGDHESHREAVGMIREAEAKHQRPIAVLQDIAGPKVRIGEVGSPLELEEGDRLVLTKESADGSGHRVSLSYPQILDQLSVGEPVFFADGTIRSVVAEVREGEAVLEIQVGGKLTSRKGVNFPKTRLGIATLTDKDRKDLRFGAIIGVDIVAVSFVRRPEDIREVREILTEAGSKALVMAKIEMTEAIENLDAIIAESDGVMVARGDLGVELGVQKVPVAQKRIIEAANRSGIPVITATQMLASMVASPYPTRAEVSDVANAVLDGTDAVMLSDETAVGAYPEAAVEVLHTTIMEAEKAYPYYRYLDGPLSVSEAIPASAANLAQVLNPKGLLVFTASGASAKRMSKFRPGHPIFANTDNIASYRKLAVVWGVEPLFVLDHTEDSDTLVYQLLERGEAAGEIDPDATYLLIMGHPTSRKGNTNLIRVLTPDGMLFLKEQCQEKQ